MNAIGYARILAKRNMGGVCFLEIRFQEQDTQCILTKKSIGNYIDIVRLPSGSIIFIDGEFSKSETGTPSVIAHSVRVVSVCRNELPDKRKGVTPRTEYVNRPIGLIGNPDSFGLFKVIAEMNRCIRNILQKHKYLEFDTGVLQSSFEAGLANSFSTSCKANGRTYHLSLTSEIKLKKLIAGGFERVYEITHSFRNEGVNSTHYPEFGILEAYRVSDSIDDSLEVIAEILIELAQASRTGVGIDVLEDDFLAPPKQIDFGDAISLSCEERASSLEELVSMHHNLFTDDMPEFTRVYKALTKIIAPRFHSPTFIMNVPKGFNPFCKLIDKGTSQAVLIAKGMHIATISVDENNVHTVRERLQRQSEESGVPMNTDYLSLLNFGIPPISGFGLGMTRLAMLLLPKDKQNVRDVILFPFI